MNSDCSQLTEQWLINQLSVRRHSEARPLVSLALPNLTAVSSMHDNAWLNVLLFSMCHIFLSQDSLGTVR